MENNRKHLTRFRNGFSDRNNIYPINKIIQLEEFSDDSRTYLKNILFACIDERIYSNIPNISLDETDLSDFLAKELFNIDLHSKQSKFDNIMIRLGSVFDEGYYSDILDTYECLNPLLSYDLYDDYYGTLKSEFQKIANEAFEHEYIGYRFVGNAILRISNDEEIKEIEKALSTDEKVNEHLLKSVDFLKENGNHDYKNSIKESICALECLISNSRHYTPNGIKSAITKICEDNHIHGALKDAILNVYGFASNEPGIRHGNHLVDHDVGYDEAKLILVFISGIINYLKIKIK